MNPYEKVNKPLFKGLSCIFFLLLWGVASYFGGVKIPSPIEVGEAFLHLAWIPTQEAIYENGILIHAAKEGHSLLGPAILASLKRIILAAVLMAFTGVPVGVLMGVSPRMNAFLSPVVDPLRSTPIVACLPLLILWFGIGEGMKIAFLWLGAVVYLVPLVRDAIKAVPQIYWVRCIDLGATRWEAIRYGILPAAAPRIWDALAVAISIEWTYLTVAEFINAKEGLGHLIQISRRMARMDEVVASILVILFLALIMFQGMLWIREKFFSWETS